MPEAIYQQKEPQSPHENSLVKRYLFLEFKKPGSVLQRSRRRSAGHLYHKCSFCSYTSYNKFHVQDHERTHTGEKPFQCTHCYKRFSKQFHLKRHMVTHSSKLFFAE